MRFHAEQERLEVPGERQRHCDTGKNAGTRSPEAVEEYTIDLNWGHHRFQKGHKIMIQVSSTWFPLVDRNPQKFCDIYSAKEADYRKATQRVYRTREQPSGVTLTVLP